MNEVPKVQPAVERNSVSWAARWTAFDLFVWMLLVAFFIVAIPELRDYFEEWEVDLGWPMELTISIANRTRRFLLLVVPLLCLFAAVNFFILVVVKNPWRTIWNAISALTPVLALVTVVVVSMYEYYRLLQQITEV